MHSLEITMKVQNTFSSLPRQADNSFQFSCESGIFDWNGDCVFDVFGLQPMVAVIIVSGIFTGVGAFLRNRK